MDVSATISQMQKNLVKHQAVYKILVASPPTVPSPFLRSTAVSLAVAITESGRPTISLSLRSIVNKDSSSRMFWKKRRNALLLETFDYSVLHKLLTAPVPGRTSLLKWLNSP
jgi:hypothetical protein